jgi:tetratricopeptide (TPR) repeat protein
MSREDFNKFGLHYVGGAAKKAAASHVVFVHGLDGKGFDTWAHSVNDETTFWPKWLEAEGGGLAIWTYAYDAASSFWRGNPGALEPTALKFLQHLEAEGLSKAPTVLVTHSLGGLVSKSLLRKLADTKNAAFLNFRGIAFFGTPHLGSPLGSELNSRVSGILSYVARKSPLAELLDFSKPELLSLNTWFQNQWSPKPVRVYFEVEPLQAVGGAVNLGLVVPQGTADPGVPGNVPYPISADHSEMCKFASKEDISFRHVSAFIGEALAYVPTAQIPFSAPKPDRKIVSIPFASLGEKFIGRERELEALHEAVSKLNGTTAIMQTVSGLGGQGKTQLAVEYAHRYASQYGAIIWLNAETPESLQSALAALCAAGKLDLPEQHAEKLSDQVSAVIRWLAERADWLVIADNANSEPARTKVIELFGTLQGKVLITTRPPKMTGNVGEFPLQSLSPESAADLLRTFSEGGRVAATTDAQDCADIVTALERHVLSLRLAAAFVRRRGISFAQYLADWRMANTQGEMLHWEGAKREIGYDKSTAVTFGLTLAALPPDARGLLDRLAYLAPEPIPDSLWAIPLEGIAFESGRNLQDCEAILEDFGLLQRVENERILHRVVQAVVRGVLAKRRDIAPQRAAIDWVNAAFEGDPTNVFSWPVLLPLVVHVEALFAIPEIDSDGESAPQVSRLLNQRALLAQTRVEFDVAEPLYRRALKIDEASYAPDHPKVAIGLNNLAGLLRSTDRLTDAEPLYRRALKILESSFGLEHPQVAATLNNLAGLLKVTNRLTEAEPLYWRALKILESSYGLEHPQVAVMLNNLALLLQSTNRLTEAEPLYRRALKIDETSYGPEHPTVAIRLGNLAQLLKSTNRATEAEPLYWQALKIQESSFGLEHPKVATTLHNLAGLLLGTSRLSEAEPLCRRALKIDEASYGPEHTEVATDLHSLAELLRLTNRLTEAEPMYRQALKIRSSRFGEDHPAVAQSLNSLAELLRSTNRLTGAEPMYRQALNIRLSSFGEDHPEVAQSLNNLAGLLCSTNRLLEAEPMYRRALSIVVAITAATGHHDLNLQVQIGNYKKCLTELKHDEVNIRREILAALAPLINRNLNDAAQSAIYDNSI